MDFTGKVVLITGASSGIGADAAKHLSKLGATLALTGRNEENLKKTAGECSSGGSILTILADLTDEEDTRRVLTETIDKFERLDVLVNSAGIFEFGSIETTSLDQLDKLFKVNVRSVYHLTMLAVPHLIKTKGCIVNVSSLMGIRADARAVSYAMVKGALDQFTKSIALDLASRGVRVNSINPALVITPLVERLIGSSGMTKEEVAKMVEGRAKSYPLGRTGLVSDTSAAIAFLASDQASFLTGVLLPIDGGRSIK